MLLDLMRAREEPHSNLRVTWLAGRANTVSQRPVVPGVAPGRTQAPLTEDTGPHAGLAALVYIGHMCGRASCITWSAMITGLSTISILLGSAIACMASRYPEHRTGMQTAGGVLLIGGLGLMGYALETVLGPP